MFGVSPDGKRFLPVKSVPSIVEGKGGSELRIVENFTEELKRLAPHPGAN